MPECYFFWGGTFTQKLKCREVSEYSRQVRLSVTVLGLLHCIFPVVSVYLCCFGVEFALPLLCVPSSLSLFPGLCSQCRIAD